MLRKLKLFFNTRILTRIPQYKRLEARNDRLQQELNKIRNKLIQSKKGNDKLFDLVQRLRSERVSAPWTRHLYRTYEFANQCHSKLANTKIDLCIAHDTHSLIAADALLTDNECALIHDAVEVPDYRDRSIPMARAMESNPLGRTLISDNEKRIMSQSNSMLTVSPGLGDILSSTFPGITPHIVRNCRYWEEANFKSDIRTECRCEAEDKLVIILNSVNFGDALTETLEVIQKLPSNIKFAMIGDTHNVDEGIALPVMLRKMKIASRVKIVGMKPPEQLIEYISGGDCILVVRRPSNLNNIISLPNRIFEAVMARVPLLVPDVQDIMRITEDYAIGMVYPNGSKSKLETALLDILSPEINGKLKNSIEKASKLLCWEEEEKELIRAISDCDIPDAGANVVILANKSLKRNNRIFRFSQTIKKMGHNVEVASLEDPVNELKIEGVTYHNIELLEKMNLEDIEEPVSNETRS